MLIITAAARARALLAAFAKNCFILIVVECFEMFVAFILLSCRRRFERLIFSSRRRGREGEKLDGIAIHHQLISLTLRDLGYEKYIVSHI